MRLEPVAWTERVTSLVAAIGITIGFALFVLLASDPMLPGVYDGAREKSPPAVAEELAYVIPETPEAGTPRLEPEDRVTPEAEREQPLQMEDVPVAEPAEESEVAATPAPATRDTASGWVLPGTSPILRPDFGSATFARPDNPLGVRPHLWSANRRPANGTRGDSSLRALVGDVAAGRRAPPAVAQEERDAKLRDDARETIAARGAGVPEPPKGGSSIPLPFGGGPSREQRQQDSIVNAKTMEMLERLRDRADSLEAARKARRDSLARERDSSRTTKPA
jgi:hypothetical protein